MVAKLKRIVYNKMTRILGGDFMRTSPKQKKAIRKKELTERLLSGQDDFTYEELKAMLYICNYYEERYLSSEESLLREPKRESTIFTGQDYLRFCKPKERDILKPYQIDEIIKHLRERDKL